MKMDVAAIRALEERGFNAWPALQTIIHDGWVLRFAAGHTKRANSANALAPAGPFAPVLRTTEGLYRRAALPLIFRLSPLAGDEPDAVLAECGFRAFDESIVMTGPIGSEAAIDPAVAIRAAPDEAWSAGFAAANNVPRGRQRTHDAMLAAIRLPAGFASLSEGGVTVAYGLAVAERGMAGLFDIATVPAARRRGAGRRLVLSLLAWGRAQKASRAWLQVAADNRPALALYEKLGFEEAYRYHYRDRP
jgi:ribosomal protein S18 acetylase RimI-like enzyme